MSIGQRLARLREQKNLTQQELSQLTGISRSRISLYEANIRKPDLKILNQLADFFGVTIDSLFGRNNKLFADPDGLLPYKFWSADTKNQSGILRYSFGVYPLTHLTSQFLYIEELEGNFIKNLLLSEGQFEFLTLVWLLNTHLNLGYILDKESNGIHRINLIIEEKDSISPIPTYKEIKSGTGLPVTLDKLFPGYENYIYNYLKKSTEAKIDFLKDYL